MRMQIPAGRRYDSGSTSATKEYEASQSPVTMPITRTGQASHTRELDTIQTSASTCPPSRTAHAVSYGTPLIIRLPVSTSKVTHP